MKSKEKNASSKPAPKKEKAEKKAEPINDTAATLKQLLTRAVTELVDTRDRVLLPVVKEQAGMRQ